MCWPPSGPPAAELIEAGFALENADAPVLHHGINLADLAHLLDLGSAGVIPPPAVRRMLAILHEKGQLKRQKRGREVVYLPRQSSASADVKEGDPKSFAQAAGRESVLVVEDDDAVRVEQVGSK